MFPVTPMRPSDGYRPKTSPAGTSVSVTKGSSSRSRGVSSPSAVGVRAEHVGARHVLSRFVHETRPG